MPNKKHLPRSIIIFDGSNFYFKLKSLNIPHLSRFDYLKFSEHIAKSTTLVDKFYAIGKIESKANDTKANQMMSK